MATVARIDSARRARAADAIRFAAADAVAAATEARRVVAEKLSARSPGRQRITAAADAFLGVMRRWALGDDTPSAQERAWAAEAMRTAQRVRDELRRTSEQLARAARRRDRTVLERALDVPADTAGAVASEVSRTLGGLADRIERAVTTVGTAATEAWGSVVPSIGIGGALILAVLVYALARR